VNPDVVGAIGRLRADGILSAAQAARFDRVARRGLVSVRRELRILLYAGGLLLSSGVGLLVAEQHRAIGQWAIAGGIGVAALACLGWVARRAAPFSWIEAPPASVALDYVLLLGLLLFAADLAFVEVRFAPLGPRWPHHLLVVGVTYLLAAYRWDSRTTLSLALTTLAAWRGISIGLMGGLLASAAAAALRPSALGLGALYAAAAVLSVRGRRKAHFEGVYATAGLLLLLGGLISGAFEGGRAWGGWLLALLIVSVLVMALAFRIGRPLYFALAVGAAYVGLVHLVFELFRPGAASPAPFLLAALLGVGVLALVSAAYRRMRAHG
jgi:Predicted membrane protein (DUF2157)